MASKSVTYSDTGKVRRVIVVGGGLGGSMTVIKLCEAGVPVDLFSLVPVKRSHSVCAQGGINASVNTKGEGDSPEVHLEETVYDNDFLANQPPVKGMADAAPGVVYMLDRMGVPFNRTPEGLLDFGRFGSTLFHRTAFAGATTGQQLLYALDEQVRRFETIEVEDDKGVAILGTQIPHARGASSAVGALVIGVIGASLGGGAVAPAGGAYDPSARLDAAGIAVLLTPIAPTAEREQDAATAAEFQPMVVQEPTPDATLLALLCVDRRRSIRLRAHATRKVESFELSAFNFLAASRSSPGG